MFAGSHLLRPTTSNLARVYFEGSVFACLVYIFTCAEIPGITDFVLYGTLFQAFISLQ